MVCLAFMICCFIKNYIQKRRIWSFYDNDWVWKNHDGTYYFWSSAFFSIILSGVLNFSLASIIVVSFRTALYAGINQGVISSVFIVSALSTAILAYLILKEKMNISHYIGMALLIICAILLSLVNTKKTSMQVSAEQRTSSVIPVLLALIS